MTKILGLDLGTNSIGWAVVDTENNTSYELINKGVRIFQEGVKIEKGIEGSKAAERTGYRSARRIKFRRKLRKYQTLKVLIEHDMCPLSMKELLKWRNYKDPETGEQKTFKLYPENDSFLAWQQTKDEKNGKKVKNPYYYRSLSASQKLDWSNQEDRFKIGRAFYHITQRRGFLSNRLETTKESDGKVKKAIAEISEAKGEHTLGQYFYEKYLKGEKIRNQYTHREAHYLKEFEAICQMQQLSPNLVTALKKAIFYQRPLKSQKGMIGKCPFETNKSRCAVSTPAFEEYRMLCFINNIKIQTPHDEKLRTLNEEEREKVIQRFYLKRDHFDFINLAEQLAPKKQCKFYKDRNKNIGDTLFNFSMKTTVSACPVSARFISLFGDDWKNLKISYENRDKRSFIDIKDVWHVLFTYDSEEKLVDFAQNRLKLNDDQIKEFLSVPIKRDYASLSFKAINKILPYLREGLIYSHAVFLAKMEDIIPNEIWSDEANRKIIREEIYNIIQSQNEEKQILEIVNGLIKTWQENNWSWSEQGETGFRVDLKEKLQKYFGKNKWDSFQPEKQNRIEENAFGLFKTHIRKNMDKGAFVKVKRIDERVKDFITDHFEIQPEKLKSLYHPSALDVYKPPVKGKDGKEYLGSPMVASVRNPMAMRALHQLRKLMNELIKQDIIDATTKVNIEMARDLKNANERKALQNWQRERENNHKEYAARIKEHFAKEGRNMEPNEAEILKYQLWEEQDHICLYTGESIGVSDFLGADPKYDIEHTIPRSVSFDNSQENKTLCDNRFNRETKRNKIPYEMENHEEILVRIEGWKEKYEDLEKQIEIQVWKSKGATTKDVKDNAIQRRHKLSFERNYWKNKYRRFTMEDVPEGFKNSQLVDTGIITKYSRLYLNTLFNKVYTVKGNTVADFRRIWGLQDEYEKKARVNHIHHCVDAVTIACITKQNYEALAKYYHESEDNMLRGIDNKPKVAKPWNTFAEDVKSIENEVMISHHTANVLPKQGKKKLRKRGKIQYNAQGEPIYLKGDTVRGSLHQQTFYGAIAQDKKGKISRDKTGEIIPKYVVRKPLDTLSDSDIKNIVDVKVREIVVEGRKEEKLLKKEIEALQKKLRTAEANEEIEVKKQIEEIKGSLQTIYALPNKNGNPVPIKKVRIYMPTVSNPIHLKGHRDKSIKNPKPYNQNIHVANDGNYLMAIYEGKNDKGKVKRDFEIVNNLKAGEYFKQSVQNVIKPQGFAKLEGLIPDFKESGKLKLPLKAVLKIGTMVILWENSPEEVWDLDLVQRLNRLYKVVGITINRIKSGNKVYEFGMGVLRFHQEANSASELKTSDGEFKMEEPYVAQRKLSHNQFNALVEGIDFKINTLGQIEKIN